MGIGTRLKIALNEYGMTVAELSRKTGISTNTFYSMIKRDNSKINPEMLRKICENTAISIYDLLDNYDELAAKYYDPDANETDREIGDYILTTIGNDNALGDIIETYEILNDLGKKVAHDRIIELSEISKYRKDQE